ncbi:hypothetical protein Bca4012_069206 [Brassica carinata]
MASDSQTATATTSDKPMENKVNEETKLMEKEIVLQETEDVVKDKPVSDLNLKVIKEEKSDQTPAGEPEKESPAVEKDENGEELNEQVEIKEPTLVAGVDTEAVDEEKSEERKETTVVKEGVSEVNTEAFDEEKAEEKQIVEIIVEENNKDKEETKVVDVSESTDEVGSKHKLGTFVFSVSLDNSDFIVNKLRLRLKKTFPSPPDVIEKAITEEKHVLEEPSKNEQEKASEAKDVVIKLPTEFENITRDTETPAAEGKSEETLKETDAESREKDTEGNKQEESVADKVSEVVEEGDELKQEAEVTTKEVAVKQKHSNSIVSKVKQSLVKAKKAIIGKSPSSKTITSEESKEVTQSHVITGHVFLERLSKRNSCFVVVISRWDCFIICFICSE